jgi:hypothetical protein
MSIPITPVDGQEYTIAGEVRKYVLSTDSYDVVPFDFTSTQVEVNLNTTDRHTHANSNVLSKFGEDAEFLPTYNSVTIDTTIAQRDVYDGLDSLNNTVSLSANNGKVLNDSQVAHSTSILNPHMVTKVQVGLGEVDNTSDSSKPISTITQLALNSKEDSFSKSTAFNRDFGTTLNTVTQGNDLRLSDSRVPLGHTHTASEVTDFDTIVTNNSAVTLNTAKVTNATHTGDVVGSSSLSIQPEKVLESMLSVPVQLKLNGSTYLNNLTATTNPTVSNDDTEGYEAGSLWFNQPTSEAFRCLLADTGLAIWQNTTLTADEITAIISGHTQVIDNTNARHTHSNNVVLNNTTASYTISEETKLAGIEELATTDQTDAEIKTAYENNTDTNVFTDLNQTNLNNQSGVNTGDQDLSGIYTKVESDARFEPLDTTILKNLDIGVTVQGYDIDTTKNDVSNTFTKPQSTSITSSSNAIVFSTSNNFTITATATLITASGLTVGQSGTIVISAAENVTGWGPEFVFKSPKTLSGTEVFAYFIENLSTVRIGVLV